MPIVVKAGILTAAVLVGFWFPENVSAIPPSAAVQYPGVHTLNPPLTVTNGTCNPEKINFFPFEQTLSYGQTTTFYVDLCLQQDVGLWVRLVEEDFFSDDTLETVTNISTSPPTGVRIIFSLECAQGGKLLGHDSNSQDSGGEHELAIEIEYDLPSFTNRYDNIGSQTGAATLLCQAPQPTATPSFCPSGIAQADGGDAGCPVGVGGIAELPDVRQERQGTRESSGPSASSLAGIIAAGTAGVVSLGGAAWYAKRRRVR